MRHRRLISVLASAMLLPGILLPAQPASARPTAGPGIDLSLLSPQQIQALEVTFAKCDPSGSPTAADAANATILNSRLRAKLAGHMTAYRVSCARMIVQTARSRGLPERAAVIAVTTAIVESGLQNYATAVDHDSLGLFQQRPSQGWGTPSQIIDPVYATNAFLNKMLRLYPDNAWMSTPIGQVCQAVQVSAFPDRYQAQAGDAQIIVDTLRSGRVDVFARGGSNQLVHKWFIRDDGGWHGWEHLGGVLASAPAVVSGEPGRVDVFARGNNNELVHKWFIRDDGGWRDWQHLGGSLTSAPAAVAWESGRVDVFARGRDRQLIHKWFVPGSGWSGWEDLGGVLASAPTAVSSEPGRVDVFARGTNDDLVHKWFIRDDGGWHGWQHLGGTLTSAPAVASGEPGRFDVFARGGSNQLVHKWFIRDDGGWHGWQHLGGTLTSAPGAATGV